MPIRDDSHGFAVGYGAQVYPRSPFEVIERVRDSDGIGKRTDTTTGSKRYALQRRDELRRTRRPAYVIDRDGRRVEV